jgi:hypothetical protein
MLARIRKAQEERRGWLHPHRAPGRHHHHRHPGRDRDPVFLNQRTNGYNAAVKTDLSNVALGVESAAVDQGGSYAAIVNGAVDAQVTVAGTPSVTTAGVTGVTYSPTVRREHLRRTAIGSATGFCLYGNNTNGGAYWTYSKAKGGLNPASFATAALAKGAC